MLRFRPVVLAVALVAGGAGSTFAQTTYDACYVPSVGAIYLIKQTGLPTACLAPAHVPFAWTSGGTLADGSVTLAKLAFDPATQAELNAVLAQLAATGTINGSANPVDWTQLKNVPAGFADGVDDGGGIATDLACTGCVAAADLASNAVTTAKVANGAVTEAKLAFNPTTQTELDSVTAGLAASGTINATTNPVDWTQLKNVPPGFADGSDDGAGGTSDHGALTGLTDDDHAQYLLTDGVRNATNGFAVTGTFGVGTIPVSGAGYRLMWYGAKGAFRAGAAIGSEWDNANIGQFSVGLGGAVTASGYTSVALGNGARATGGYSIAMGYLSGAVGDSSTAIGSQVTANGIGATATGVRTRADGLGSTAMGMATTAVGNYSTAMGWGTSAFFGSTAAGYGTTASGLYSTAMGLNTTTSGSYATAMGYGTTASGDGSTAMGYSTNATATASTAMGYNTTASALGSTAMGYGPTASGPYSTAMGSNTTASGNYSTALGLGTTAQGFNSLAIGRYNVIAGSPTTEVSTDPVLMVGNGGGSASRSNALTLLKNGHMTIAGALTQSSDLRYKEAIEPLGRALDDVLRLQPIHYRFREGTGHPTERRIGLGAQDVERVFPELVHRDSQGYLSVAYTDLAAVLVRAVQEQEQTIAALRAELAALRADVAALRTQTGASR